MRGTAGYASWRWIFLMEGVITIFLSILAFIFVVDLPEKAKFLTAEEKAFVLKRLQSDDSESGPDVDTSPLTLRQILKIASHWKVVLGYVSFSNDSLAH
jgi:hypothetical protein